MVKPAKISQWVGHKIDQQILRQLSKLANATSVAEIAVMPDVHIAGDVCNGIVVATERYLYPQCVGGDIGCGYLSVKLVPIAGVMSNFEFQEAMATRAIAGEILSRIGQAVPVNKHSEKRIFDIEVVLSNPRLEKSAGRDGRLQLGTLGRGNHFVELQLDQDQQFWLLIHSGSRSMGQQISNHHLQSAERDSESGLAKFTADSEAGKLFLNDLAWAREYAAKNRLAIVDAIVTKALLPIGVELDRSSIIHRDHNHVEKETFSDGAEYWVHRKGAQRLGNGVQTVVPGSMAGTTFVVEGRSNRKSLNSCSHGAGREMSRKQAATRLSVKSLRQRMDGVCFDDRMARKLLDESPDAYKDIRRVMKAQRDLVRIVGRRQPVLNFKGR